ncbi:hypothetical protein [Carboxylicivirga marina]|uniref:hypothetical protein n=1 Tax=Carboxylicivirga marina TaxID=2800988 RepID=UPI0025929369|nr:hypothetical protein [uncultured Carboxylicivirga sp.]
MKQLILLVSMLAISFGSAMGIKKDNSARKAEKVSKEMQVVLGFNDEMYQKVYALNLERFTEESKLKETYGEDIEVLKAARKTMIKSYYKKLTEAVGAEEIKKWRPHQKAKMKNKA